MINDQLHERFEVKTKERLVKNQGLVFLAQLSSGQRVASRKIFFKGWK